MSRIIIIVLNIVTICVVHGQSNSVLRVAVETNGFSDESVYRFDPSATNAFDAGLDAKKLFSVNQQVPHLFTTDPDWNYYSINSVSTAIPKDSALEFYLIQPETEVVRVNVSFENLFLDQPVHLQFYQGDSYTIYGDTSIQVQKEKTDLRQPVYPFFRFKNLMFSIPDDEVDDEQEVNPPTLNTPNPNGPAYFFSKEEGLFLDCSNCTGSPIQTVVSATGGVVLFTSLKQNGFLGHVKERIFVIDAAYDGHEFTLYAVVKE